MKSVTTLLLGGAVVSVFFAAGAMAEGTIYTRSADAAHADLVRDWNYRATGANTGIVRQRHLHPPAVRGKAQHRFGRGEIIESDCHRPSLRTVSALCPNRNFLASSSTTGWMLTCFPFS